jgi:hypothetical protein
MVFKEKLEKQFLNFKIGIPHIAKHNLHLYADYVELIALFNNTEISKSDILDRLFDEGIELNSEDTKAESDDTNERWIEEVFELAEYRKELFSDDYPFQVNRNFIKINSKFSKKNKIYLSLLISSSLNYFNELQSEITTEFEIISSYCLKDYMPKNAIVKSTGKRSDYEGTASEKIRKIAADTNIVLNEQELSNISKRNSQEKGLDLISWIPFGDKIPNLLAILAQCSCGKDWYKKQNETERYENYLQFYHKKPIHTLYIPYSLSRKDSLFFQSDDITGDRIIFDRKRILEFLQDTAFFDKLNVSEIVNQSIIYEEDIV